MFAGLSQRGSYGARYGLLRSFRVYERFIFFGVRSSHRIWIIKSFSVACSCVPYPQKGLFHDITAQPIPLNYLLHSAWITTSCVADRGHAFLGLGSQSKARTLEHDHTGTGFRGSQYSVTTLLEMALLVRLNLFREQKYGQPAGKCHNQVPGNIP